MTDLAPLLLLWAIGKRGGPSTPRWPSAASPPPSLPMPPLPHGAETSTPLADLAQPQPQPRSPAKPPSDRKVKKPLTRAQAVRRALKKPNTIVQRVMKMGPPAPEQMNAQVSDIQKMLNKQGAKLKHDGLYGPKTVAAYTAWADRKKQSRMITRVNPRTVRVAKDAMLLLSLP